MLAELGWRRCRAFFDFSEDWCESVITGFGFFDSVCELFEVKEWDSKLCAFCVFFFESLERYSKFTKLYGSISRPQLYCVLQAKLRTLQKSIFPVHRWIRAE